MDLMSASSFPNTNTHDCVALSVSTTCFCSCSRLALALAHVDYTDHRVKQGGEWPALKPTTPYGQLPIVEGLMDSDDTTTSQPKAQSGAMLRYIGKHYSKTLYPDKALYAVEEALGVVADMKRSWEPCLYMGMAPDKFGHPKDHGKTPEGQELVKMMRTRWLDTELPKFAGFLDKLLKANNHQWLASTDAPTIADCDAVVFLRSLTRGHMDHVPKDCLDKYPVLVDYVKRFCALPEIQGRYTNGLY